MQVNSSKNFYDLLQECKQHKQNLMSSHKIDPASLLYATDHGDENMKQTDNM